MFPVINIDNLHVFDGSKDLGHVIDVVRSGLADPSECKAALDLAWIAKHDQVNDQRRENDRLSLELADLAATEEA